MGAGYGMVAILQLTAAQATIITFTTNNYTNINNRQAYEAYRNSNRQVEFNDSLTNEIKSQEYNGQPMKLLHSRNWSPYGSISPAIFNSSITPEPPPPPNRVAAQKVQFHEKEPQNDHQDDKFGITDNGITYQEDIFNASVSSKTPAPSKLIARHRSGFFLHSSKVESNVSFDTTKSPKQYIATQASYLSINKSVINSSLQITNEDEFSTTSTSSIFPLQSELLTVSQQSFTDPQQSSSSDNELSGSLPTSPEGTLQQPSTPVSHTTEISSILLASSTILSPERITNYPLPTTTQVTFIAETESSQPTAPSTEAEEYPLTLRVWGTVALCLVLIAGVAGNAVVVAVVYVNAELRHSTNLFLLNLAMADVLVLLVCLPTALVELNTPPNTWVLGPVMCVTVAVVEVAVVRASVLTLVVISVERYLAICRPFVSETPTCTPPRAGAVCAAVWVFALLAALPTLPTTHYTTSTIKSPPSSSSDASGGVSSSLVGHCRTGLQEMWAVSYHVVSAGLFVLLPLLLLTAVYARIASRLLSHRPRRCSAAQQWKAKKQVVVMLGTVVAVFFVCVTPFQALTLWIVLSSDQAISRLSAETYYNLLFASRLLLYVNSAANPIIYNAMSSKFRLAAIRLIKRRTSKRPLRRQSTMTTSVSSTSFVTLRRRASAVLHRTLSRRSDADLTPAAGGSATKPMLSSSQEENTSDSCTIRKPSTSLSSCHVICSNDDQSSAEQNNTTSKLLNYDSRSTLQEVCCINNDSERFSSKGKSTKCIHYDGNEGCILSKASDVETCKICNLGNQSGTKNNYEKVQNCNISIANCNSNHEVIDTSRDNNLDHSSCRRSFHKERKSRNNIPSDPAIVSRSSNNFGICGDVLEVIDNISEVSVVGDLEGNNKDYIVSSTIMPPVLPSKKVSFKQVIGD